MWREEEKERGEEEKGRPNCTQLCLSTPHRWKGRKNGNNGWDSLMAIVDGLL